MVVAYNAHLGSAAAPSTTNQRVTVRMKQKLFNPGFLLAGLALCLSSAAWAAGNVDSVIGEVSVINRDGQPRGINKGDRIVEGETVLTGTKGEVLITTDDSGVLAIRPLSRLLIEQYKVNGNDKDSVVLTLLRGGLRSVTGWISKTAPRNYRLATSTATIGIRGTDHEAAIVDEGADTGTWNRVTEGATALTTSAGQLDQNAGTNSAVGKVQAGDQGPVAAAAPAGLFGPRASDLRFNLLKDNAQKNQAQRLQMRQQQVSGVGGLSSQGNPRISFQCAPDAPAQRALDSVLRAYERGDVAFIQQRLDPAIIGYGSIINDLMTTNNLQRQTRLQVLNRQMQCAPDVAVINFNWRKTYLSSTNFTPVQEQGRTSVLITDLGAGAAGKWSIKGISGDPLFKPTTVAAGHDGTITASPSVVSYASTSFGVTNLNTIIEVKDVDLTAPSVAVQVTTSNGDSETLNLPQVSPGIYRITQIAIRRFPPTPSVVTPGNGTFDILPTTPISIVLTLKYNDAKAASGAAVIRQATLVLTP